MEAAVTSKKHRILQQQQYVRVLSATSLSFSDSNDGKHQDTTPISALRNEVKDKPKGVERNVIFTVEASFDYIRSNNGIYVYKT